MKISEMFERKALKRQKGDTGPQQYRTSFKWSLNGGRMVSGRGATQEEADTACLEKIRARFRGTYEPIYLYYRGCLLLGWRDGDQWKMGYLREETAPVSQTWSDWSTREEIEQEMRFTLAMHEWDEQEEASEIITDPKEQERFKDWARTQKRWAAQYQRLQEVGWTKEEAGHLLSGVSASPARVQELGDPWQVMREVERMWWEGADHDY